MGILGMVQVTESFDPDWFIPSGTYIASANSVRDTYFASLNGKGATPVAVYAKNTAKPPLDYFYLQDELQALADGLKVSKPGSLGVSPLQSKSRH